jgi:hypothetical protein
MSEDFLPPTPPPLVAPKTAREVARAYLVLADSLAEAKLADKSAAALHTSSWWLTYSLALSQGEGSD